jgi:hypothetical protein
VAPLDARWCLLVLVAVAVDAVTTMLGLSLGLAEAGLAASMILPLLGPLYFLLEAPYSTGSTGCWSAGCRGTGLL